jgi:hypothetical protein
MLRLAETNRDVASCTGDVRLSQKRLIAKPQDCPNEQQRRHKITAHAQTEYASR